MKNCSRFFNNFAVPRRTFINPKRLIKMTSLDQIQLGYLKEECILVDELDNVIGSASKGDCHAKETASLHRAFSVFLFNSNRQLILQRRSKFKITFPLVWTNSCCSHPLNVPDELDMSNNLAGIRKAAVRKLAHELNIHGLDVDQLELAGRFLYKADSDDKWMEHELDYVILVRNFELPINANPEEVDDVKYVSRNELEKMANSKYFKFSPWFDLLYRSKWLNKWWDKLDSNEAVVYDQKNS